MTNEQETGQDIWLTGNSSQQYSGKIYGDKDARSTISGRAIAVLSNSTQTDEGWAHRVNSVYNTDGVANELDRFKSRDDISHLILLPYSDNENDITDKVDDLIRSYVHQS